MNERQKMIDKIKKVLALAENNPSENEAIAASLKAQKMMAEYHIKEEELFDEITEEKIVAMRSELSGKNAKWRIMLALVLAKNFRCKCFGDYDKTIVFYGYKTDAEICHNVYQTMYKIGNKLAQKLKREERETWGTAKGIMNTFCLGFVDGIRSELEKQCTALMIITPKEVEVGFENDVVKKKNTRTTRNRLGSMVNDKAIYDKGYQSGKNAIMARGIQGS